MELNNLAKIWPEWQIEKQLGKGSYGVVYKAVRRDHNVESTSAIKVISIPSDASEIDSLRSEGLDMDASRTYLQGIVDDFVREIQLMESLKGVPNIVNVEDYQVIEKTDEIGWDIVIRMELLTPFSEYICDRKLTEAEVIKLGCDICTALEICSKRNVIHRDIKPENIFVNEFGYFKLGDFGIARKMENLTGGLSQRGTFNYIAPEVANGREYDARVDIYSLGIMLYRLLNKNRLPFLDTEKQIFTLNERKDAVERRLSGEILPAPCEASEAMADLILRACAYNQKERFATAAEMKQALMDVQNGTYQMIPDELDGTVTVRPIPSDYDKTVSVRKAPESAKQETKQNINTFENKPKKKGCLPKLLILAIIIFVVVTFGTVAVVAFVGISYMQSSETDTKMRDDTLSNQEDEVENEEAVSSEEEDSEFESSQEQGSTTTYVAPNVTQDAILSAHASSILEEPQFGLIHSAERVLDENLNTGWVEGVAGQGIGESITLTLDGTYQVSGFSIKAGYQTNEALYYKNSRPEKIRVIFSDGTYYDCMLYDNFGAQIVRFDRPVETNSITFRIESVYPGNKYEDTVITEISLF